MSDNIVDLCHSSILDIAKSDIPASCHERFLPLETPSSASLQDAGVLLAGLSELVPGYLMSRPTPMFHMVLFVLKGTGVVVSPAGRRQIREGQVMVSPAGIPNGFFPERKGFKMAWFHLEDRPAWAHLHRRGPGVWEANLLHPLVLSMEGALAESMAGDKRDAAVRLWGELTLHYLERELAEADDQRDREHHARIRRVFQTVQMKLAHHWTVPEMAGLAYASVTHFHRLVRRAYGKPPLMMVTDLRMTQAANLLRQGLPVQQVAAQVGYDNPFSFSTAFKRHWGVPPSRW